MKRSELKLKWERVPSVTTGGKRFFYIARINEGRDEIATRFARVVWNRSVLAYAATIDDRRTTLGYYNDPLRAMTACEIALGC